MATFSAPAAKEHVKGLRAQIVHRADQEFPFLHDTMIVPLDGRLLMAWYNCSENEIVGRTIIRGRWSADHGQTWSEPEIICEDVRPEHHMVPVTFTEENGEKKLLTSCADAIVDPKQPDCEYPFDKICGAVVAYKVMQILYEKLGLDKTDFKE